MIRYRFRFSKEPRSDYINSLDFVKKILISNFELANTGKKYRFSLGPALPFGWYSECEYLDAVFLKREDNQFVRDIVEKNLPPDLRLIEVKTIPLHFPSIESACDLVEIMIEGERRFSDLILNSNFAEFFYDCFKRENSLHIFIYYRKVSRDIIKSIIDFLSADTKINKIVRKNMYWIDLNGNIKIF